MSLSRGWWISLLFTAALIALRIYAVLAGLLYGAGRVAVIDVVISLMLVLLVAQVWRASPASSSKRAQPSTFGDRVGVVAAVLGIPALVAALLNVVAPINPQGLSSPACGGARARGKHLFLGVTVGEIGNFARSGPGLSFAQTDRFNKDCTIGFEGYCIGDGVEDAVIKGWSETRWLRVAQYVRQPYRTIAQYVSGEPKDLRFVSMAAVAPKSPDRSLNYLGDKTCQGVGGTPKPGKPAVIAPKTATGGVVHLGLQANFSAWIGVAVSLPPQVLTEGSAVRKIDAEQTDAAGKTAVDWKAGNTIKSMQPKRSKPVTVDVLAVACLGPIAPADQYAVVSYQIGTSGQVTQVKVSGPVPVDNLRRAACDPD